MPENISLYVQDAFESFPKDFHGLYDIVHIALFILVIPNNDPSVLIRNLLELLSPFALRFMILGVVCLYGCCSHDSLEPGGYLQWNEVDTSSRRVICAENGPAVTPAIDELEGYLKRRRSGTPPESVLLICHKLPQTC